MDSFPSLVLGRRNFVRGSVLTGRQLACPCSAPARLPSPRTRSTDPYPIPWLDKNGSHISPQVQIWSRRIFSTLKGSWPGAVRHWDGTDNQGNRITFGSPTHRLWRDARRYWAARSAQQGVFTTYDWHCFGGRRLPTNQIHDFHLPIAAQRTVLVVRFPLVAWRWDPTASLSLLRCKRSRGRSTKVARARR